MARPTITLAVTEAERAILQSWTRASKTPAADKLRAQIILACAKGESGAISASRLLVSEQTISKWRRRFERYRIRTQSWTPKP